jgi:hypothetical protein
MAQENKPKISGENTRYEQVVDCLFLLVTKGKPLRAK